MHVNESLTVSKSSDSATNWHQCAKVIGGIRHQSDCGCCCFLFQVLRQHPTR